MGGKDEMDGWGWGKGVAGEICSGPQVGAHATLSKMIKIL